MTKEQMLIKHLQKTLHSVVEDVNWMTNNQQLLSSWVFNYLDEAIELCDHYVSENIEENA